MSLKLIHPKKESPMRTCPNCATRLQPEQNFCHFCGTRYVEAQASQQAQDQNIYVSNQAREQVVTEYDFPIYQESTYYAGGPEYAATDYFAINDEADLPKQYRPLSPWEIVIVGVLAALLPAGGLLAVIYSFIVIFAQKNKNRKNMAGAFLITALVFVIVAIIVITIFYLFALFVFMDFYSGTGF